LRGFCVPQAAGKTALREKIDRLIEQPWPRFSHRAPFHGGALREMSITNDFLYRSAVHLLHQQRVAGFRPQE
jgi:hypothetical protein